MLNLLEIISSKIASDAVQATGYVPISGVLVIDRTPEHEWGYLKIDNVIRQNIFDSLNVGEVIAENEGWMLPDYDAHVSVFDEEEVKKLPVKIEEEGQEFVCWLQDTAYVQPEGWKEVETLVMVRVDSPKLETLREKYSFTSLMHKDYDFHMTIAIKEREAKIASKIISSYSAK